ncbi:MAG: hypothetical protein ACYSOY_08345, partial [Planctomycetota bacterium]
RAPIALAAPAAASALLAVLLICLKASRPHAALEIAETAKRHKPFCRGCFFLGIIRQAQYNESQFRNEAVMKLFSNFYFRWFAAGFAFGFLYSVIYLLIEGPPFLSVPQWVEITGYPGITLGWWFYEEVHSSELPAEAFGSVVNGLSYGLLFLIPGFLIRKIRRRN